MTKSTTTRSAPLDKASVRTDSDGAITFPLSSTHPVRTYSGMEILKHSAECVDLTWLNSGNAPLLDSHNRHSVANQLGVV